MRSDFKPERIAELGRNENPFGPSPRVIAALAESGNLAARYPDGECTALKAALSRFLSVPVERLIVGSGAENLIEIACRAWLNPGERVLTQAPGFGLHERCARLMSAVVDRVAFNSDFQFDVSAWERALVKPVKMILITSPSNPVGCRIDDATFCRILGCAPAGALLLIDEAYYEYGRRPGYCDSIAHLKRQSLPWLVLRTFSKAYGLAGLRLGYGIVSSAELVEVFARVRTPFNVNAFAQVAAVAALGDQCHVLRSVEAIHSERAYVRGVLERFGYRVAPSHANFLFFDCAEHAGVLAERLLARGVIVKAWRDTGYEQFIRVTIGSREDNDQFLATLRDVAAKESIRCVARRV